MNTPSIAPEPVGLPMVRQKFNEMEELIAIVHSRLEELVERLAPICTPPQPQASESVLVETPRSMSPVATSIQSRNGELRTLCSKIDSLLSILEV